MADTVNKEGGNLSVEEAADVIKQYFGTFKKLKKWLDNTHTFIKDNGYIYTFFGRKRRVPNVFSTDKGIAAHEVRSATNAVIQATASDVNLFAAMETAKAIKHLDANIFMLVHDSIVSIVKDEHVDEYCKILRSITQKDRGCSIPEFPIGVDQEIGQDYSFGKFDKVYKIENGILIKNDS